MLLLMGSASLISWLPWGWTTQLLHIWCDNWVTCRLLFSTPAPTLGGLCTLVGSYQWAVLAKHEATQHIIVLFSPSCPAVSRLNMSLGSVSLDYVKDIDLRAQGLLEATFVNDSVYGSAGPFGVIWKVSKANGESFYFAQVGFPKELYSFRCYGMLLFLSLACSADLCSVTVCWMWCSIVVLSLFSYCSIFHSTFFQWKWVPCTVWVPTCCPFASSSVSQVWTSPMP